MGLNIFIQKRTREPHTGLSGGTPGRSGTGGLSLGGERESVPPLGGIELFHLAMPYIPPFRSSYIIRKALLKSKRAPEYSGAQDSMP
jgi:hypothetical protein